MKITFPMWIVRRRQRLGNELIPWAKALIASQEFNYWLIKTRRDRIALRTWERAGRPAPPPHIIKENIVKEYAARFRTRVLIETGTYLGDMVHAMKGSFDKIVSFELDPVLYQDARKRFAKDSHISIIEGDSGSLLAEYLNSVTEPCLFWLDGHFSGGITARAAICTPIQNELRSILSHDNNHVVLIDDARCFTGENDYPTLHEVQLMVSQLRPGWNVEVANDIIRIHEK